MKKWMTTSQSSLPKVKSNLSEVQVFDKPSDYYYKRNIYSPYIYANMENRPPAKLPDEVEDDIYDRIEIYEPDASTSNASQTKNVASTSSAVSGDDPIYSHPYVEQGMFNGPVTDLDEESDPDEIKQYNPNTKTISITKPRGKHNVEVQINLQLKNLEHDIQRMIEEMASLEGSVQSDYSRGNDSGIHEPHDDANRIENNIQGNRVSEPTPVGTQNEKLVWNERNRWILPRPKNEKNIKTVTCLVNENFDENRVFKSTVTGVPLGLSDTGLGPPKQAPDWRSGVPRYHKRQPVKPKKRCQGFRAFCTVMTLALALVLVSVTERAVSNVQSGFNTQLGFGMAELMTVQAAKVVAALFVPTVITVLPGRKWAFFCGALLSGVWPAAQLLSPSRKELFGAGAVAAAVQGLAEVFLLGAAFPLVAEVVDPHGPGAVAGAIAAMVFAQELGHAAGSLLDAGVLVHRDEPWIPHGSVNSCLLNHCAPPPIEHSGKLWSQMNIIWLPLLALPLLSAFIAASAVHPPNKDKRTLSDLVQTNRRGLVTHLFDCRLLLLVPSAALSGLLDTFFIADLPKEMSACAWGGSRSTLGTAAAALGHAVLAALLAPVVSHNAGRLPAAASCTLLLAAAGVLAACDWTVSDPQRLLLPAALAGAGAASDVASTAAAAYAFPERRTMAFSVLLGARAGGSLVLLGVSNLLCLNVKLLLLAGCLLVALTSTAALERLWGVGQPPPLPGLETDLQAGEESPTGRHSPDDGLVEVPLGRSTNY